MDRRQRGATIILALVVATLGFPSLIWYGATRPPRRPISASPSAYGLQYEEVSFPSNQPGLWLNGWYLPSPRTSTCTVIFAHGYRSNRLMGGKSLELGRELVSKGFNVLTFDFRGHGTSSSAPVTLGSMECHDLMGAISYAKQRGASRIGLIGYSMGAAASLMTASTEPAVRAVVADSSFSNLYEYLSASLPGMRFLPVLVIPYIIHINRVFGGVDARQVSPRHAVENVSPRPILFIHGDNDVVVPVSESQRLKDSSSGPSDQLWVVKGAEHAGCYEAAPEEYTRRVVTFMTEHVMEDEAQAICADEVSRGR